MKLNQVKNAKLPEPGELLWYALDPTGGGMIADKCWVPALWIDLEKHGHLARALIQGKVTICNIGRFHRGEAPPDEGEAWV